MSRKPNTFRSTTPPGRLRPASNVESIGGNKSYVLPRVPNLNAIIHVSKLSEAPIMEKYPDYFVEEIIHKDEIREVDDIYNTGMCSRRA